MKPSITKIAKWFGRTVDKNVTAAVIVAAGNSTRMGGTTNKQFLELHGVPVLAHTLLAYQHCKLIREIVVVTKPENFEAVYQMAKKFCITSLPRWQQAVLPVRSLPKTALRSCRTTCDMLPLPTARDV